VTHLCVPKCKKFYVKKHTSKKAGTKEEVKTNERDASNVNENKVRKKIRQQQIKIVKQLWTLDALNMTNPYEIIT
jgi:hypothetical protein